MRTLKCIVLAVLLLTTIGCSAQFNDWWKDHRYGIHAAYAWQGSSSLELGAYRMWTSNPPIERRDSPYTLEEPRISWSPIGFWSTGAAIEIPLGAKEFLVGPKLFSELNISFMSFSLSTTSYTNFKRVDLRVTPGAGITFYGTFGVRYEHNFSLQKSIFDTIEMNRITVFINIIKDDFPGY